MVSAPSVVHGGLDHSPGEPGDHLDPRANESPLPPRAINVPGDTIHSFLQEQGPQSWKACLRILALLFASCVALGKFPTFLCQARGGNGSACINQVV